MTLGRYGGLAWVAGLLALSCGCEVAAGGGIAGAGGTGSQAGSASVGTFIGAGGFYPTQELCPPDPATEPSCPIQGQLCEYGDDPRLLCRPRFVCSRAGPDPQAWGRPLKINCPPLDPSLCPLDPETRVLCTDPKALCVYPDGTLCGCASM